MTRALRALVVAPCRLLADDAGRPGAGSGDADGDHALTDSEGVDVLSERVDDADRFEAEDGWQLGREPVAAAQDVQIARMNRGRLHTDSHLTAPGFGHGALLQVQHLSRLAHGVCDKGLHRSHPDRCSFLFSGR
jgi:hypothetical protein